MSPEYRHEMDRINQFKNEAAGDREKFERKILLRSSKTAPAKRERFAAALRLLGETELATRVLMVGAMKEMAE